MATRKTLPSRELVQALLDYDPATGVFTWKSRPRERFATKRGFSVWNIRFAGKSAGGTSPDGRRFVIVIKSDLFLASRLAWLHAHGEPIPYEIDHADNDPLNNRLANLRAATHSQNLANKPVRKDSSTGIKGITRHRKRYIARIKYEGVSIYLGLFVTAEEAGRAYREAAIRLFGKFARW